MLRHFSRNFRPQLTKRCYYITRQCVAAHQTLQSVATKDDRLLEIKWNDGNADKYPYLYLRENCRCSECYNAVFKARKYYVPKSIDLNLAVKSANFDDGNKLDVVWDDGHTSTYSLEFLKQIRYQPPSENLCDAVLESGVRLWGSDLYEGRLPAFDFEKVVEDDDEMYKWLTTVLATTGVAKLVNVPKKVGQLKRLGDKVGYLVATIYGQTEFPIKSGDRVETNIAYTTDELSVHTDYTFASKSPVISLLHCIEQTETIDGGENILVDAFHAAKLLYEENPKAFQILSEVPVRYENQAQTLVGTFHSVVFRRILSLNHNGTLKTIAYNDEFRDAFMPYPPETMADFYHAYFRFTELLHDKRTSFQAKMQAGEMFTINNHRVLHGRSAYQDSGNNVRHIQVGYIDWDCTSAKLRAMAKEKGEPCPVD